MGTALIPIDTNPSHTRITPCHKSKCRTHSQKLARKMGTYKPPIYFLFNRCGIITMAPFDVVVPLGSTGLNPSQTSFSLGSQYSQVLNIPTKINEAAVIIITLVELIKKGNKMGSSEAAHLAKLGIRPSSYGLVVLTVYDNSSVISPEVLDEEDLFEKSRGTSLAMAIIAATIAVAPPMLINGYENALVISEETEAIRMNSVVLMFTVSFRPRKLRRIFLVILLSWVIMLQRGHTRNRWLRVFLIFGSVELWLGACDIGDKDHGY